MDIKKITDKITLPVIIFIIILVGVWLLFGDKVSETREKQQMQEFIFEMKERCRNVGSKLYEEDVETLGSNNVFNSEYHYNQKLNTCLYAGGQVKKGYFEKWVKDSLTNKWIIAFIEIGEGEKQKVLTVGCPECLSSYEEFERRKQELFSE